MDNGSVVAIHPFDQDPDPSPVLGNIANALRHPARVTQPMIRKGWLENGPGRSDRRATEPFVPVSWDTAVELLAKELGRVYGEFGAASVYGGSYGWASAGRFHHAQSQVHRFLNTLGGYTSSVNSYSMAAGEVIMPHVIGDWWEVTGSTTTWPVILNNTEVWLCFGGIPLKNTYVSPGGVGRHEVKDNLASARGRGIEFVLVSPLRDDLIEAAGGSWWPIRPGTDVALMLAISHTLVAEGLYDRAYVERYCAGFEHFERYLLGHEDGQAKTAEWAAAITELPAEEIRRLARRLPGKRVMVTTTWSLQRTEHGEQKPWAAIALAALLGQIGLPGGGYGYGYGSAHMVGGPVNTLGAPSLPQGKNPVEAFIPVARTADMLLNPGGTFDYDGERYTYPDIKVVYWAGGNPFHQGQNLPKLRRALAKPDTIVVHDPFWTSMARHADIVIPSTMTLERNDIGGPPNDRYLIAMHQAVEPVGQARNDYDVYSAVTAALGVGEAFSEGRDEEAWLRHMYAGWRERAAKRGVDVPDFDSFWQEGFIEVPVQEERVAYQAFYEDPDANPLETPSGRIELFSEKVASFGYDDCPGHPSWIEPREWLGGERAKEYPILLIANNPKTRLHSQLDVGNYSQSSKVQGREPIRLNPRDAEQRGIADGDVVRVFNDRGSLLAGVIVSEDVRPQVAQLSTGAWYDPADPEDLDAMCVHGNANVLTLDQGASRLSQGSVGQHVLVQIERWDKPLPPIKVLEPPPTER